MRNDVQFKSADDYFDSLPESLLLKLLELKSYILEAAPHAIELINYNIPAYALIKGGKRDKQIMIAGYEKHVGFYPTPSIISKFAKELSPYKSGKGSVQFPLNEPLPKDLIIAMVRTRMEELNI